MPRDSNGLYTLPAGNPVISGSTITPTWANPTMDDLGAEITDSLSRSGQGGMLVPFEFTDGDAGNPGISWAAEPSTGFYRAGTLDMRATVGGQDVVQFLFGQARLLHDGTVRFQTDALGAIGFGTRFDWDAGGDATIQNIMRNSIGGMGWRLNAITGQGSFTQTDAAGAGQQTWQTLDRNGAITLFNTGVPKFATLVDGVQVLTAADEDLKLVMQQLSFGMQIRMGATGGTVFEQLDGAGAFEANFLTFTRNGAVTARWNNADAFATQDATLAAAVNSSASVYDGSGVPRPIGFNVMPRVDVGASTVRVLTLLDAGKRFRMQANTGVLQLADFGNEAAINIYCSAAAGVGSVVRVASGGTLRYYGGDNGQLNFTGPVDVPIEGGSAFTIVQFGVNLWEMWGGQLL